MLTSAHFRLCAKLRAAAATSLSFSSLRQPLLLQVASLVGKEGDATPFTDVTVENISAALHKCVLHSAAWAAAFRRTPVC